LFTTAVSIYAMVGLSHGIKLQMETPATVMSMTQNQVADENLATGKATEKKKAEGDLD